MSPTLQHDPSLEWLAFGSHNDAIVLAPRARIVFTPMELKAGELQFIKSDKQVLRPLITVAAFPDAMINEEIIENRRPEHPVFSPQLAHSGVGTLCRQSCLFPFHPRRKGPEFVGELLSLRRITLWDFERDGLSLFVAQGRLGPHPKDYENNAKTTHRSNLRFHSARWEDHCLSDTDIKGLH